MPLDATHACMSLMSDSLKNTNCENLLNVMAITIMNIYMAMIVNDLTNSFSSLHTHISHGTKLMAKTYFGREHYNFWTN